MTNKEKDRLIELLIEAFDDSSEREGIYFGEEKNTLELLNLLAIHQPDKDERKLAYEDYKTNFA